MTPHNESSHRSTIFFACLLTGIILIIPAVWIHDLVMVKLTEAGNPPANWVRDTTGIFFAILPTLILSLFSVRFLDKKYPDSPPGKIPEPHERPSANKR